MDETGVSEEYYTTLDVRRIKGSLRKLASSKILISDF